MRILLFFLALISSSFAYITATNGGFNSTNKLIYTDGIYINVPAHGAISTNLKFSLERFTPLEKSEKTEVDCFTVNSTQNPKTKKCYQTVNLPLIKFNQIFVFLMFGNVMNDDELFVEINGKIYKAKIKSEIVEYKSKIFGSAINGVTKISINIDKYKRRPPVVIYKYNDLPLEFIINGHSYKLKQILNSSVSEYKNINKTKPITLNSFDFTKEKIWATYKAKTKEGIRYLNVSFEMQDPANSLFLLKLVGSGLILDPRKNSDEKYTIDSYLVDLDKEPPYEYRKELKIDNENILLWQQDKPGNVALVYKDENNNQRQKGIMSSKSVYDINGIWYLVSWLDKMNKDSFSFSYLNVGRLEGKVRKDADSYIVTAGLGSNNLLKYKFKLDQYHRVVSVEDLKNGVQIKLFKPYTNKTIQNNIKYIENYKTQHGLKVINEN